MATKNTTETTSKRNRPAPMKVEEGFHEVSTDLVGFYNYKDGDNTIYFVPISVTLMDSNINPHQPQALIIARLTKPAKVVAGKGDDMEVVQANAGDMIGIWYKPGMRPIANCGGVETKMYQEGSKDTGMPTEMLCFRVAAKGNGKHLSVIEDRRDKSRGLGIHGLVVAPSTSVSSTNVSDDEIPF